MDLGQWDIGACLKLTTPTLWQHPILRALLTASFGFPSISALPTSTFHAAPATIHVAAGCARHSISNTSAFSAKKEKTVVDFAENADDEYLLLHWK
uniref:Uncharacterized protein n=1 Tax=Oryza barthii TaxID=65489 RepID=A0A0D3FEE2_9ORYZ